MKFFHKALVVGWGVLFAGSCSVPEQAATTATTSATDTSTSTDTNAAETTSTETSTSEALSFDDDGVVTSAPQVGSLSIGGLPASEAAASLSSLELSEALSVSQDIVSATAQMTLNISDFSSQSSALTSSEEEDSCSQDGIFCLADAFGNIYDMVTHAARCNMNLLLKKANGEAKALKQVAGHPIFYADGWGTIGIGEGGTTFCPTHEDVRAWLYENELAQTATAELTDDGDEDEEFYFPTRFVIYRRADGSYFWNVVYFPKDFIGDLAAKVDFFESFLSKDLDFVGFHGTGTGLSASTGELTLDWDEIGRLVSTIDQIEAEESSASLKLITEEDSEQESSGMPQGQIRVTYDYSVEGLQRLTTTFLGDFSFGDDEDTPFENDQPTLILKSDTESYLHFVSRQQLSDPEDQNADSGDPLRTVAFDCDDPGNGGSNPYRTIQLEDVATQNYLSTDPEFHVQIIWKNLQSGQSTPSEYIAAFYAEQGGPFYLGDTEFRMQKKDSFNGSLVRVKAPTTSICSNLVDDWAAVPAQYGGPYLVLDPSSGFRNILRPEVNGQPSGSPTLLLDQDIGSYRPTFSDFRLVDVTDDQATPVISSP